LVIKSGEYNVQPEKEILLKVFKKVKKSKKKKNKIKVKKECEKAIKEESRGDHK